MIKSETPNEVLLKQIRNQFNEKIKDKRYGKLMSLRKELLGYMYLVMSENVVVADFIRSDGRESEEVLKEAHNLPLPFNNQFNWEVILSGSLMIIRYHHSLADVISAYNIFSDLFCKPNPLKDAYANKLLSSLNIKNLSCKRNIALNTKDRRTVFYRDCYEGNSTAFICENNERFVKKIKIISKNTNSTFLAILLSCYSASLSKVIEARQDELPKYLSCICPRQIDIPRLAKLLSNKACYEFGNKFCGLIVKIPIRSKDYDMLERLRLTKEYLKNSMESHMVKLGYLCGIYFFRVFPIPLLRFVFGRFKLTSGVSCVPGGPKLELFNGDTIENQFFLINHLDQVCLSLSILTYDDRLQLGIIGSKDEQLNQVLNGIFHAIDQLYVEAQIRITTDSTVTC
ncbi:PREDICTED: uncharacterized protein LOC108561232 [Nicrophorus vespilloides]|uniref:Uncharacterized protein LOC108561232 n=1 Tax=Nicrophorus vespilloides TaxID=110193 RepID=A0ABM1MJ18_NICVS|nr:PREDICTED: uncharacterized protein LOC108561232 [Nicrophorus vespilloides]